MLGQCSWCGCRCVENCRTERIEDLRRNKDKEKTRQKRHKGEKEMEAERCRQSGSQREIRTKFSEWELGRSSSQPVGNGQRQNREKIRIRGYFRTEIKQKQRKGERKEKKSKEKKKRKKRKRVRKEILELRPSNKIKHRVWKRRRKSEEWKENTERRHRSWPIQRDFPLAPYVRER